MIEFDVEKLLKPYQEGGTEQSPVKRSLKTIATSLMYKNKIPVEVVGAAIFKVFDRMANNNLEFKGDGSYGSRGRELFSCIKAQCLDILEQQSVNNVKKTIMEMTSCTRHCEKRTRELRKLIRCDKVVLFLNKPRGYWKL